MLRGRFLSSGEEILGYIFFENMNFDNPILEINPFTGSYPIKVKLK